MLHQFSRTELLLGQEGVARLAASHVAVFGIGGVGGYTVEALARSGVGTLSLIDDDSVCLTNLNRQLYATHKTIGKCKVEVAKARILEINPNVVVHTHRLFYTPQTATDFDFSPFDYIVDAVDTVSAKIHLACKAKQLGIPIISSMGAGNKMDPTAFRVADLYQTEACPLARVMRRELRKRGLEALKVVYSIEPAITPLESEEMSAQDHPVCPTPTVRSCTKRRQIPGSNAFVPPVAGLIIAGEVVKDLTGYKAT